MCLKIETTVRPARVVNRWKFLACDKNGNLHSPCEDYTWNKYACNVAELDPTPSNSFYFKQDQAGFHVFTTRRHAERAVKRWGYISDSYIYGKMHMVIVKLKVEDFISGGKIDNCDKYSDGKPGEIWGQASIVKVYGVPKECRRN
jgi:hypothetical protein